MIRVSSHQLICVYIHTVCCFAAIYIIVTFRCCKQLQRKKEGKISDVNTSDDDPHAINKCYFF